MHHEFKKPLCGWLLSTLLLTPLVASGCATAPWQCTSDTCVSVATEDLPEGVHGTWRGTDGSLIEVDAIYVGDLEDRVVFSRAATMHWDPRPPAWGDAHVTSFDGRVAIAEQRLGLADEAPRRFHRLRVNGDRLDVAELRPDALMAMPHGDDVRLVRTDFGEAVVYEDVRAMAATIRQLLDDPEVWESDRMYLRASG